MSGAQMQRAMPGSGRVRVDVITTCDAASTLASEWRDLMTRARSTGVTPFQRPEWLLPWLRIFTSEPDQGQPFIITVRDGDGPNDRLIGLLPAVRVSPSHLELAGGDISDYRTPIVDGSAEAQPKACDALREAIAREGFSCAFDDVPPHSPWIEAVQGDPDWHVEPGCVCPVVSLPGSADAWMDALPNGLRRNIRRYGQRLADEDGTIACKTLTRDADPAAVEAALAALFRTHGRRWHERAETGVLLDHHIRRFHQLSTPALLSSGVLRLHTLSTASTIIAVMYVMVQDQRAYAYISGFDPDSSHFSPGMLLTAYAMQHAIEDGCAIFDFLRGAESYKYTWGAVNSTSANARRL
jgi:CelD/BcsL family acetyltransferase involved in cellulose biosynthesis